LRRSITLAMFILLLASSCVALPPSGGVRVEADTPSDTARLAIHASYKPSREDDDPPKRDSADTLADVAKRVNGAVVRVRAVVTDAARDGTEDGEIRATRTRLGGTGIVIAADGIILTNEHVIRNADTVTVTLADGTVHEVMRIARAPKLDLAALWIDAVTETVLVPDEGAADPGIPVVAISAARREKPRGVQTGIITRPTVSLQNELDESRTRYYDDLIECSAKLEPGYSGGPLLDADGRLLGINVAALGEPRDAYARSYAIPLHTANRRVIDRLIAQLHEQCSLTLGLTDWCVPALEQ